MQPGDIFLQPCHKFHSATRIPPVLIIRHSIYRPYMFINAFMPETSA
jgi:hypothetical protein